MSDVSVRIGADASELRGAMSRDLEDLRRRLAGLAGAGCTRIKRRRHHPGPHQRAFFCAGRDARLPYKIQDKSPNHEFF